MTYTSKIPIIGWQIPLQEGIYWLQQPSPETLDEDGRQQGEHIDGYVICPECDLAWPLIHNPSAWDEDGSVIDWDGGLAYCLECRNIFMNSYDGVWMLAHKFD